MNKKVLVATDSFKGSMTSKEVGEIITSVLTNAFDVPLADGGEGSLDVIQSVFKDTHKISFNGISTYGEKETHNYLIHENTAYIESSIISGFNEARTILKSTSKGIGLALLDAFERGMQDVNIFLGGTGCNDGGMGLLEALGYQFYDDKDQYLKGNTQNIGKIHTIKAPPKQIKFNSVNLISDVTNSLLGPLGATRTFGPQKGASIDIIDTIEKSMAHYAQLIAHHFQKDYASTPASGAAGGIAFSLMNLFDVEIISGIEYISDLVELEKHIIKNDIIITGEGKIDAHSFYGKTISHVISLCHQFNKPYILICGINELRDYKDDLLLGIYQMVDYSKNIKKSMENPSYVLLKMINDIKVESI